jgi:predicted acylesterase/phospholipase RssA
VTYLQKSRDEHLQNDGSPKRILALDGGGLRGIVTLGFLEEIEQILRDRHGGGDGFRLSHYFDLIAGNSTGSIIAAALAQGWSTQQIVEKYMSLGKAVFEKSLLRHGLLRAKYDEGKLIDELQEVYGADTTLGSDKLQTGLLVMTKRLDTGSPWPISNNPRGKYFNTRPKGVIGNGDYPLWQVVRASTAAPSYFEPEPITIAEMPGHPPTEGEFVDGGVSPFNNPALQTFMYATLDGYRVGWPVGAQKILLVSVGTGAADPNVKPSSITAVHALNALLSLMNDCASLQETILQWMSTSSTTRTIDRELGDLRQDLVGQAPLLSYLRYNVDLGKERVQELDPALIDEELIASLSSMDAPENMEVLHKLALTAAGRDVSAGDFESNFDLPRE